MEVFLEHFAFIIFQCISVFISLNPIPAKKIEILLYEILSRHSYYRRLKLSIILCSLFYYSDPQ